MKEKFWVSTRFIAWSRTALPLLQLNAECTEWDEQMGPSSVAKRYSTSQKISWIVRNPNVHLCVKICHWSPSWFTSIHNLLRIPLGVSQFSINEFRFTGWPDSTDGLSTYSAYVHVCRKLHAYANIHLKTSQMVHCLSYNYSLNMNYYPVVSRCHLQHTHLTKPHMSVPNHTQMAAFTQILHFASKYTCSD